MFFSLVPPNWFDGERRGWPMGVLVRWAVVSRVRARGHPRDAKRPRFADRRIALVIGNGKYENAGVLANPINDANAIGDLLKKAGFDVVDLRLDLGVVEFKRAVREFVDRAANADVAVVYYSGHGLEFGGVNYLIPVDAKLTSVLDMDDEAVSLDRVLVAAGHVKKLSLIILDACRENPFHPTADDARVTRGVSMGLAGVGQTVADTLIAFAAKAGSVSYDGDGRIARSRPRSSNISPSQASIFGSRSARCATTSLRATNHRQEPYVYGSLGGDNVALVPAAPRRRTCAVPRLRRMWPPSPATLRETADEASDYRTAERAASLDGWRSFLAVHPDGAYARLARTEIDKLLARTERAGGVEDGGSRAALARRALQARRGSPRSPARQSHERRGHAFRERTELREVAAPTFAPDGKPGLRHARALGARQAARCGAGCSG